MKRNNIIIAIQKEGRLKSQSIGLLDSWGLVFSKENGRTLLVPCRNAAVEILFVRHSDIPQYVQSNVADFGIVGLSLLCENSFNIKVVQKLGFGKCSLVIAAPKESGIQSIDDLDGERIATSYPNCLRQFLKEKKINASIIKIRGSVEITPKLGLVDAICDLTQTGKTLKENGLKPIAAIYKSEAVLIESLSQKAERKKFLERYL